MTDKIDVAIVAATGYTGNELIRLLLPHPHVNLGFIGSRRLYGQKLTQHFPQFSPCDLRFEETSLARLKEFQLVFFATPHGYCMNLAPQLLEAGVKLIDLSADFRIKDTEVWQHWYGQPHTAPDLISQAVYGLTELNRLAIKKAKLVANPGCYPTVVSLALAPLLRSGLLQPQVIIADCKSGASGAGRSAKEQLLYGEINESIHAYNVGGHRHQAEIDAQIQHSPNPEIQVQFTPHLLPMHQGMLATLYLETEQGADRIRAILHDYYAQEDFVHVIDDDRPIRTADVRGTNLCLLQVHATRRSDRLVVVGVIDNLLKGASGQAVQNMNAMFSWPETTGFVQCALKK